MGSYLPSTAEERRAMLSAIGLSSVREMYADVPESVYLKGKLGLPDGLSEMEVMRAIEELAGKNHRYRTILRGAGAYRHYIPAIVKSVTAKEEFVTAYTPYQAEISQGILQSIFEYQTMICELTGMDVSNASVYDGASAAAEAAAMCRERARVKTLVSGAVHPDVLRTVQTYAKFSGHEVEIVPTKDGATDPDALKALLADDVACLIVQQPNFFGCIEDVDSLFAAAHDQKVKCIMSVNPIAAALLKTPAECGADIAVGEGQPLGLPLSYGGPYLGFMACKQPLMRRLPGRIVGETVDHDGNRAYVLTLQAREQHIRREKASSNICSNEALCALTAGAYLTAMGAKGLTDVAGQCVAKAHYFADELQKIGFTRANGNEFFHEFLTASPVDVDKALAALENADILGGLKVDGGILWCVTEVVTKAEIDRAIAVLKEVRA